VPARDGMSLPAPTVTPMDHLPLTRSAPWTEIPPASGIETLFPELPPPGSRPVEVTVTVPDGDSRRCVMDIVAAEDDAPRAVATALGACRGVDGFELTARRFRG
jgi:hypothetical protein